MKILSYDEEADLLTVESNPDQVHIMRTLIKLSHEVDHILADMEEDDFPLLKKLLSDLGPASDDGIIRFQIHDELLALFPSLATAALTDNIVKGTNSERAKQIRQDVRIYFRRYVRFSESDHLLPQ